MGKDRIDLLGHLLQQQHDTVGLAGEERHEAGHRQRQGGDDDGSEQGEGDGLACLVGDADALEPWRHQLDQLVDEQAEDEGREEAQLKHRQQAEDGQDLGRDFDPRPAGRRRGFWRHAGEFTQLHGEIIGGAADFVLTLAFCCRPRGRGHSIRAGESEGWAVEQSRFGFATAGLGDPGRRRDRDRQGRQGRPSGPPEEPADRYRDIDMQLNSPKRSARP